MAFSIKDEEADALARRLSRLTGESLTTAVRKALAERLEREQRQRDRDGLAARLHDIALRGAIDLRRKSGRSLDHDTLFYDENGLFR